MRFAAQVPDGYLVAAFVAASGLLFSVLGWIVVQQFSQNGDVREIKATVTAELSHNGGASMKDAISDLQSGQVMVCRQIEEVRVEASNLGEKTAFELAARDARFGKLEESHGEILTRIDDLSSQLGREAAKVIGVVDSSRVDIPLPPAPEF